jgi:glycerol uptake facilitator-like aquaporin
MLGKFLAEILGTFIFLSVIITSGHATSRCADALTWIKIGLALAVSILLVGYVSGGHLNPAVSFMFYLNKDIDITGLFVYIVGQIIGATLAYFYYVFLNKTHKNLFSK